MFLFCFTKKTYIFFIKGILWFWRNITLFISKFIDFSIKYFKIKYIIDIYKSTNKSQCNKADEKSRITNSSFYFSNYNNLLNNNQNYLNHKFNLLGSGWTEVGYYKEYKGFNKIIYKFPQPSNKADKIKSKITNSLKINICDLENYSPIDWQIDFISGFRWNENTWYMDIKIGENPGADIKIPWELSRFQHLPQIAFGFATDNSKEHLAKECVLQITDWIVSNPVRYGVNWRTSMEVAIRACNWLLTYELIKTSKHNTNEFKDIFFSSLVQHGNHIKHNLERGYQFPGHNHFMANIVGLIFLGICTDTKQSNKWLKFGIKEFYKAIDVQFYKDGGHFEGSSYYHRLVFEMVLHTIILISNNKDIVSKKTKIFKDVPIDIFKRIESIFSFYLALISPDERLFQYGDNDSGRFFNLTGLTDKNIQYFIKNLATEFLYQNSCNKNCISRLFLNENLNCNKHLNIKDRTFINNDIINFFPNSKIYINNYSNFSIAIVLRNATLGHTHNDLLSFELFVGKNQFIVDGGSYCYTSDINLRNKFRSTHAHNTLVAFGQEQNEMNNIFSLNPKAKIKIEKIDSKNIIAGHDGYKIIHTRSFKFETNYLEINDSFDGESSLCFNLAPNVAIEKKQDNELLMSSGDVTLALKMEGINSYKIEEGYYSEYYGVRLKNSRLILLRKSKNSMINFQMIDPFEYIEVKRGC